MELSRQLRVANDVAEFIRKSHPHLKKKIRAAMKMILVDPGSGKALKEELTGLRSFRVSTFRIIYRLSSDDNIDIITIGPRIRIYGETFRIISKGDR